ncbi:hypothetical protein LDC_0021 [sediment metagenome]|uniref:Uncharacterized protein n=1 Tax=sediment metagenome TaxID=749907 RepID=D9PEU3_9ZZZZ
MGTFSIKVVANRGHGVSGAKVTVDFGLWNGQNSEYTDNNGWTSFSNLDGEMVTGEFFINGESFGEHSTYDEETYSFTI